MKYLLGLDIGSVTAKIALLSDSGTPQLVRSNKITSNPRTSVNALFREVEQQIDVKDIASCGVTGSGKAIIPVEWKWPEYSSSLATATGVLRCHPDARTIIQIGGQTSLVIELERGLERPWKVGANPLCAAGTGRFLEQQAYRLGIKIEEFGEIAASFKGSAPRIAARCSVFAKSDLIHLQQKGVAVEAMLFALSESIARMVLSLRKGVLAEPVYFVGGVAANGAIARALNEQLSLRNGHPTEVTIPDDYQAIEAIGTALLSKSATSSTFGRLPDEGNSKRFFDLPALGGAELPTGSRPEKIVNPGKGYLGVDVGSTSTKAVIVDEDGKRILAKNYIMTAGRPVDAVKRVFENLLAEGADRVTISGVGVTGSGRYLVGSLIGADIVKNEITAQTRAAVEIDQDADIVEIGGQDSKLVIKRNGVVVDYQMNKACAAGTGSFIDEMAEMLGVSVKNGEFASLALDAPCTVELGTRCAAFMGQAIPAAQSDGVPMNVIAASLANSIAKNYLSKVVGTRKLGRKVILTGAVFYNHAVVAAFRDQLPDRQLIVAPEREVSGAIGAALIAKEAMAGRPSKFKGLAKVIGASCELSIFTCKSCDNNCAITRMTVPDEKPTFYGSRCDKYDSTLVQSAGRTLFDERQDLLFKEYKEDGGNGPTVGIPRSLLVYDYAPLLIGFLNALGVRVRMSGKSSKDIIEKSLELAYTDSCFPMKLLHGHVSSLGNCDFLLFPSAIRLGLMDGNENQKYACPLVQASPFIVRQVMNLGAKALIPTLDFSRGDDDVIASLTEVGSTMGFTKEAGRRAAIVGLQAQRRNEQERASLAEKLLETLKSSGKLGVVLIGRSYMSQDAGANLGIAEKLAQLGVVPIPLDFLPLNTINPKDFSDRPYWAYEGKFLAAAKIVADSPRLFALALTNFGCGPNSFMLKQLEDIMGHKPLGQLEIDEHAAEAGIVTRLEAFVDTIEGFARSNEATSTPIDGIYRSAAARVSAAKTLIIPRMAPHADVMAAAMQAFGVHAVSLPEPDERNLQYSNPVTSGTECLPYRVTLGDFIRFYRDGGHDTTDVEGFMAGSFGPCRQGKYAIEQIHTLKQLGYDLAIRTTVSNNAYRDIGLGAGFERLAWRGMVAVDSLQRLLWRARPYESKSGTSDALFDLYLARISESVKKRSGLGPVLRQASREFSSLIDEKTPRRPLVGINGEIYLRSNRFSNRDLAKACENAGLEVVISPIGEWLKYTSFRNLEDSLKWRKWDAVVKSFLKKHVQDHDEGTVRKCFDGLIEDKEPSTAAVLAKSSQFLSPRCGSEAVLSIGTGIEWLENPRFSGVISVMPHGCMPGGIVAAMSDKFSDEYGKPWISLTYDGFLESNNSIKINEFAELVRFCHKSQP